MAMTRGAPRGVRQKKPPRGVEQRRDSGAACRQHNLNGEDAKQETYQTKVIAWDD
jgi:hypothetical protein